MGKEFYFGLDLGTENIGYAVTDENYKIKKASGKRAIGVRVFDEANTAAERRTHRSNRRTLERRRYRINLLQEIFEEEMNRKDCNFFRKLNESDLHLEDRSTNKGKYSLFNDKKFTDKQYYKKFPTIYHLRKYLMENEVDDIRLLYLAVHHIIKYRGNFITAGGLKDYKSPKKSFEDLNEALIEMHAECNMLDSNNKVDIEPFGDLSNVDKISDIIIDKTIKRKEKIMQVCGILNASKRQKILIEMIFGGLVNLITLFGKDKYSVDSLEKSKFYFSDDFDVIEPILSSSLESYEYNIVMSLKALYDYQILTSILANNKYLSDAMISKYNKHKTDLKNLKYIIKKYIPEKYDYMFDEPSDLKINNYTNYIGGGTYNGVKLGKVFINGKWCINEKQISRNGRLGVTCESQDDFYKTVKSILLNLSIESDEDKRIISAMFDDMNDYSFMPKINCKLNSAIPYQLNQIELNRILEKQSQHFSFLQQVDQGVTNIEKIISLLTFRIPYFVGPVKYFDKNKQLDNIWAVRNPGYEKERVTPWNFDKVINIAESNKIYINRMTNNCTYLKNEKTLPKNSVLFSIFVVLQEVNKIAVNGELIQNEVKQGLIKDLYLTKGKPTRNEIINYIKKKYMRDDVDISLSELDMHANMKSYVILKNKLGNKIDKYPDMAENIIYYCTVFDKDNNFVEKQIREKYGKNSNNYILSDEEIERIKHLRFEGWSTLSAELLVGSRYKNGIMLKDNCGVEHDILEIMWNSNLNLMEIINSKKYDFKNAIQKYNISNQIEINSNITYEDVDELYCSAPVKRMLYQAFLIIEELTRIFGRPKKIFIESTKGDKGNVNNSRSITRKDALLQLFEEAKQLNKQLYNELCLDVHNKLIKENDIKTEKMYLYYMQLGKDAYSGEDIELDRLCDYDVDHIIPQSVTKDDSINNKVLVSKISNEEKSNKYPIPHKFRQIKLWQILNQLKLISNDKLYRLMRTTKISSEEQDRFISRQLVETTQAVKELNNILNRYFNIDNNEKVEIVLNKGCNVVDFRNQFGILKSREANNIHHGVDAYLNIVVGNILTEEFYYNRFCTSHQNGTINDGERRSYNIKKIFDRSIYSYRDKKYVWHPINHEESTLKIILHQLNSYDYQISKKVVTGKGQLYYETIFKAGTGGIYPIKNSMKDLTKYGARKSSGTAYFVIVDSVDKKMHSKRTIEAIPIYFDKLISLGKMTIEQYLSEYVGLNNPTIAEIDGLKTGRLLIGSLLEIDNAGIKTRLRLAGTTRRALVLHNANELFVTTEQNDYIKEITSIIEKISKRFMYEKNNFRDKSLNDKEIKQRILMDLENNKKIRLSLESQRTKIIQITRKENGKLYELFLDKLENPKSPYHYIPTYSNFAVILRNGQEYFNSLDEYCQISALLKLLVAFQCNAKKVDASDIEYVNNLGQKIKGGTEQCAIKMNNDITERNIMYISQSITGIKEKHIKICC